MRRGGEGAARIWPLEDLINDVRVRTIVRQTHNEIYISDAFMLPISFNIYSVLSRKNLKIVNL